MTNSKQLILIFIFSLMCIIILSEYEYFQYIPQIISTSKSQNENDIIITKHCDIDSSSIIKWNNISIVRKKLSYYFSNGQIIYIKNRTDAIWNISLQSFKIFNFNDLINCYSNKWILFDGDSRLRYSYAEWIKMVNNTKSNNIDYNLDMYFPQNSKCPFAGNHKKCEIWFKGKDCEYSNCLRDFYSTNLKTGRWTFNSLLTNTTYKSLITSSIQPNILFYVSGAWDIYNLYKLNKLKNITMDDYYQIIKNIIKIMKNIDNKVKNKNTIKFWMSYPECHEMTNENTKYTKVLNNGIRDFINKDNHKNNWIFFRLPTPSLPIYCEGFHVRDKWTAIENQVISNALCG